MSSDIRPSRLARLARGEPLQQTQQMGTSIENSSVTSKRVKDASKLLAQELSSTPTVPSRGPGEPVNVSVTVQPHHMPYNGGWGRVRERGLGANSPLGLKSGARQPGVETLSLNEMAEAELQSGPDTQQSKESGLNESGLNETVTVAVHHGNSREFYSRQMREMQAGNPNPIELRHRCPNPSCNHLSLIAACCRTRPV